MLIYRLPIIQFNPVEDTIESIKLLKNLSSILGKENSVLLRVLNSHFSDILPSYFLKQDMYASEFIQDFQDRIWLLWFCRKKIFVELVENSMLSERLTLPMPGLVNSIDKLAGETVPKGFQQSQSCCLAYQADTGVIDFVRYSLYDLTK